MKINLGDIYALAQTAIDYSDFLTELGYLTGIPRTDAKSQDLIIENIWLNNGWENLKDSGLDKPFKKSE